MTRGEDTEESDIDILVDPAGRMTLFDLGGILNELSELLGVEVDVLTPDALPDKYRERLLAEAAPI